MFARPFVWILFTTLAGCGGNVVVDASGQGATSPGVGGASSSGSGGGPLTSSATGPTSVTGTGADSSVSSSSGTGGSGGNGGSSSVVVGSSSASTGAGGCACPDTGDACSIGVCNGSVCSGSAPTPEGTVCGHAGHKVCDGAGSCVDCNTPADCPAPSTVCDTWSCVDHHCHYAPSPTGMVCGPGATCHDGDCHGCHSVADCPAPPICQIEECSNHYCVTGTMPDHTACVQSNGSAGVCITAGCVACSHDGDCAGGGVCIHHACWQASCANGVRDGGESDVDCGGPCPPCRAAKACVGDGDCRSNHCYDHTCG